MANSTDSAARSLLDLAETYSTPIGEMESVKKLIDTAAAPVQDAVKDAMAELNLSAAETLAAQQRELNEINESLKIPSLDSEIYRLRSAGLPPIPKPNFPALPEPMPVELHEPMPVRVELPEAEPASWWKQGWVWGAIGSVLVLINIIVTLV